MDNRTGFRRRGHGYLADQARSALGITGEVRVLAEIPLPMVHTAFGLAVATAIGMPPTRTIPTATVAATYRKA